MLNFFAVRHGKGPCDACAGRVKQQTVSVVKTETVIIKTARDFYEACKEHLETHNTEGCVHFIQTFEFTPKFPIGPILVNGPLYQTQGKFIASLMYQRNK